MKGTLGMEHLSLKRLSAEGLWGGLLYLGPWKICQERLRIRAYLSIGAIYVQVEPGIRRGSYTGDFE